MKKSALLFALLFLVACSNKSDDGGSSEGAANTPLETVVSGQQIITDEDAGSGTGTVDDPGPSNPSPPPPPYTDFRPDAVPTYTIPTAFQNADPRTFTPAAAFDPGCLSYGLSFTRSNIFVPSLGWVL